MDEKIQWGKLIPGKLMERWPRDEHGEPEEPVFLCHCKNIDFEDSIRINMLETYGIPCLRVYPGDGSFGSLILGVSGQGAHIYVPKSLLNDAKALCEEENNDEL